MYPNSPGHDPAPYGNTGPVVLPKGTLGMRSWRRERQKRQRRNRRLAGLLIVSLVVAGSFFVVRFHSTGRTPKRGHHGLHRTTGRSGILPLAMAVSDQSGDVQAILVIAPYFSGRGGSVLVIPPNLLTMVVPGGPQEITNALESTPNSPASEKLIATLENLLGIQVGSSISVNYLGLESLLDGVGPVTVNLPTQITPAQGSPGESFGPGPTSVAPSQVGDFISDTSGGGSVEQLARIGQLFNGWVNAIRTQGSSRQNTTSSQPGSGGSTSTGVGSQVPGAGMVAKYLDDLAKGTPEIEVIPATEIAAPTQGAPQEFQFDQAQYETLAPGLYPDQAFTYRNRPKVQLLNGTGALGVDEQGILRIVPYAQVTLTGNACTTQSSGQQACFGYNHTEIITYDKTGVQDAAKVQRMLGLGTILHSYNPGGIVDMTVIIGADFHVNG